MANAEVIGYEGKRDRRALASWGAAAIRYGDQLVNGATRFEQPYNEEEVATLADRGALTLLPESLAITLRAADKPVVLELALSFITLADLEDVHPPQSPRAKHDFPESRVWVFKTLESFGLFRQLLVDRIVHRFLYEEPDAETKRRLVGTGLILHAHSGPLNALKAFMAEGNREFAHDLARASLRTDAARAQFDRMFKALTVVTSPNGVASKMYQILYEDGVAHSQGLNINYALEILHSIKSIDQFSAERLQRNFAFLNKPPPSQLHAMLPSSAKLQFAPKVLDEPLGDRVARYLSLAMTQDVIGGKLSEEIEGKPAVRKALNTIVKPTSATTVQHQRLDETDFTPVEAPEEPEPDVLELLSPEAYSPPLTLLGYQSGLLDDWGKIELNIFPGMRLRLSTLKDRSGNTPLGVDALKKRKEGFLFRPAAITIVRQVVKGGRRKYHLQKIELLSSLGAAGAAITAIPSSIVHDAFVFGLELPAREDGNSLVVPQRLEERTSRRQAEAQKWMQTWGAVARELELGDLRYRRLAPVRLPTPAPIIRLLMVLVDADEPLPLDEAYMRVRDRFGRDLVVDLAALYEKHSAFFAVEDAILRPTDEGKRHLAAYRAIENRAVVRRPAG